MRREKEAVNRGIELNDLLEAERQRVYELQEELKKFMPPAKK